MIFGDFIKYPADEESQDSRYREKVTGKKRGVGQASVCVQSETRVVGNRQLKEKARCSDKFVHQRQTKVTLLSQ